MAIDLCSEISSAGISPRISFSHDLKNKEDGDDPLEDHRRRRSDLYLLDSSSDFVFCISNNGLPQELSSADELFSNGKIVPMENNKLKFPNASSSSSSSNETHRFSDSAVRPRSESSSSGCTEKKKRLIEFLNEEEKPQSRSFWQFKRSSSLNYEGTRGKSLIRSLQFLSRSNSTGSAVPNPKQTEIPKETQKQRLQKQSSVSSRRSSSSSFSSSSTFYFYSSCQTQYPSLKKKCGASGNGVRISPVLNLPQAYIPKAYVGFFGFGSLFCNGKIKKKK